MDAGSSLNCSNQSPITRRKKGRKKIHLNVEKKINKERKKNKKKRDIKIIQAFVP